jgi:hypothetical protein
MRSKQVIVILLCPIFAALSGCVVNRAISASAVADNLAVEKAQNEVLLLNILRAQEHLPMYLTGISKITGSIKAEAALNPTAPFGSVTGGATAIEAGTRAHYMAAATATYNWNPSFDVNVLDTNEFMRGFMSQVSGDTFAYYWNQDYPPELLFHLLVQKIQVRVTHNVCATTPGTRDVDEYVFHNHPDALDPDFTELEQFSRIVNYLMTQKPYMGSGDGEILEPGLTKDEALDAKALVEALKAGFTLKKDDKKAAPVTGPTGPSGPPGPSGPTEPTFNFQRATAPAVLKFDLNTARWQELYIWVEATGAKPASPGAKSAKKGIEFNFRLEQSRGEPESACKSLPSAASTTPAPGAAAEGKPANGEAAVLFTAPAGGFKGAGLVKASSDTLPAKMTITFSLRSPEAILYYLGEHARVEKTLRKAFYVCLQHDPEPFFAPVFMVRTEGCTEKAVQATTADGSSYFIPTGEKSALACVDEGKAFDLSCLPGASTTALSVISQLISLQKSAKDLPTTSVVRVVGQ